MPIIVWNDANALGIAKIDDHHRHLFTLLNTSYDMFSGGGYKVEIEHLIEELINYATYHFAAEEGLMSHYGYPGAEAHLKQHEHFIQQITTFQKEFVGGWKTLTLELIVFLKDWLREHISKSDRAYADFTVPELEKNQSPGIRIDMA